MKNRLAVIVVLLICIGLVYLLRSHPKQTSVAEETVPEENVVIPAYAQALLQAYPNYIAGYEDGFILFRDGEKMRCDDEIQKDYLERLDNTDIEDMFQQPYQTGKIIIPSYLYDPGRYRCEAFFKKMYGASEEEVRDKLVAVDWFGQSIPFTTVNHAADSLKAVERDILKHYPQLKKYFEQSSSFYWRKVRGAERLSAHSYGMTVDICVKYSDFWRWSNPGKSETDSLSYKNRIPEEIIRVFEKHGFISGAKWYHYDTMHFEFRPDLLLFSEL